jgi:4-nitrophenol 2-monooxygenase / 4-nitrocatechol 4-monooxygenase, reductase component
MTATPHPEIDKALFRQIAGSFATGVTAVTTRGPAGDHGMTASSFTSLSLEPPLVLVCLDLRSSTLEAIEDAGCFAVNILTQSQERVSRTLAIPGSHDLAGISTRPGRLGMPLIDGSLAHFECRLAQRYVEGDHVILIGAVEAGSASEGDAPLLYFRGGYGRLYGGLGKLG